MSEDKPLISVCFMCYNRKKFVATALESVLAQTYSPLEIVVSDNCSTDGTKEIVSDLIQKYKQSGGVHEIIFNSNATNIGGIKNIEKCASLAHGELIVFAHDDDISMPNRVEEVTKAWLATGKKATTIVHGWYKMNFAGRYVGEQSPWGGLRYWDVVCSAEDCLINCWPLGAATAVVPDVFRKFLPIEDPRAYDDYCWLYRSMMLGVPCYIPNRLIRYRIGSGATTECSIRKSQIRNGEGGLSSARQAIKDMACLGNATQSRWIACVRKAIEHHSSDCKDVAACFSATGIREKWRLFHSRNLMLQSTLPRRYLAPLFLLPNWIGDPLINAATSLLWRYRAWKYRNHPLNKYH